jgi:hypothetical protein
MNWAGAMKTRISPNPAVATPPLRCAEPFPRGFQLEEDDIQWATRSNMWRARAERPLVRRTKRAKAAHALALAGHGVSMRIVGGALTIQTGFTHYPQTRQTIRFFKATCHCPNGSSFWMAAEALPLMLYPGSRSKRSYLFESIGMATLSVSLAHQDIRPIHFGSNGNGKPVAIRQIEMNFADR